jgi:hypothetical protein
MEPTTEPWTPDQGSASGQVFEFRLWAALTEQSRGQLHVFLPLEDRGVDALVHRMSDGAYLPVQAKGRSELVDGEVHLVVWADSLPDDNVLIVSGLIVDGGFGPTMLVVPAGDFKHLANRSTHEGRPIYSMEFGMRPRSDSRWLPWLVPSELLAGRFGAGAPTVEKAPTAAPPSWRSDLGFLGESEVIRRLAESEDLNLFRAFPDSETAEIPVLHLTSRRVVGLQVKTVSVTRDRLRATVNIRGSSFRPAASTYFVVLAWLRDEARFYDEILLIPSVHLREIAHDDGYGHIALEFEPGSATRGEYRLALANLRNRIHEMCEA